MNFPKKNIASQISTSLPKVSVIIPCFNHGAYLEDAIESVQRQTYPAVEVIVVDDGSTDNSNAVAQKYSGVKYVFQQNQGLSAARNTGIRHSTGEYLVFLDADDWLYPEALEINVNHLQQNSQLAFVSGSYNNVYTSTQQIVPIVKAVKQNHHIQLLKGNYIGMHATVMFRKWVFNHFSYDPTLKACEDYDLYLKITRKHPVLHHTHILAAYRRHSTNMSGNINLMLNAVLKVLERQKGELHHEAEFAAYNEGVRIWKSFYLPFLYKSIQANNTLSMNDIYTILKHRPYLGIKQLLKISLRKTRNRVKRLSFGPKKNNSPVLGQIKPGDFLRVTPFSTQFGYDRGGPVDRHYIERFLEREAASIKGRILEIGDNAYTIQYGADKVTQSDILHVDDSNPNATLVGDLSNAPDLPADTFDCIILTQTLQFIYNFREALYTCHRILKPGGTLLLTVPGITPLDHGEWKETWYWSFTDKAMKKLIQESFPGSAIEVHPYGNVFTATAFLYGMGLPEVPADMLKHDDPHYQVIVTVKATKATS